MPKKTPEKIWESIKEYYDNHKAYVENNNIYFDFEKKKAFVDTFKDMYDKILSNYMRDGVSSLDHHKQTAIIIYSLIRNSVIVEKEKNNVDFGENPKEASSNNNKIFVELESIALKAGLEYMLCMLNKLLREIGEDEIEVYDLPIPISCDNGYNIVLIRQLFYDFKYGNISNPEVYILSLANVLYLIEYISLINHSINIEALSIYVRSKEKYKEKAWFYQAFSFSQYFMLNCEKKMKLRFENSCVIIVISISM